MGGTPLVTRNPRTRSAGGTTRGASAGGTGRGLASAGRASRVAGELRARGHAVEVGPPWSEGRLSAARSEGGLLKAGANPRGMQGYAVGR